MGDKRALIVDDSKSARLFLARILERYEIDVDSAESAEAAIEYLTSNRPDVIFMDHLMPGMDGFQAVQAIKNNPRTATIPILMYTSQEGELYLGQARALGAVGVLPKQIKQADVSKVLYQLHLVSDRRSSGQSTFRAMHLPDEEEDLEDQVMPAGGTVMSKPLTDTALREQFAELRRALVAGVDTQTDRIIAEVRALLLEALPPPSPGTTLTSRSPVPWGWVVASVALAIALASTALWWRDVSLLSTVRVELAQLRRAVAERPLMMPAVQSTSAPAPEAASPEPSTQGSAASEAPAAAAPLAAAEATRTDRPPAPVTPAALRRPLPTEARPTIVPVPYGADALGGARLEAIRQLLYRLAKESVGGVVDIKTFAGRFCLVGNPMDGFSLAPDETPFAKCDVVGNPSDDALSPAQRTPLALANLIGDVRNSTRGTLVVQSSVGDAAATIVPYPQLSTDLTAGEWNRAGSANNRIEIRFH
jgi:CheY-like chemotaxis protein